MTHVSEEGRVGQVENGMPRHVPVASSVSSSSSSSCKRAGKADEAVAVSRSVERSPVRGQHPRIHSSMEYG